MMKAHRSTKSQNEQPSTVSNPTWNDDVGPLFRSPCWVADSSTIGSNWIQQMYEWSPPGEQPLYLDLSDRKSVQFNAVTVYQHLWSKSMPITSNPGEYWPDDALKTFRLWANQGFRESLSNPIVPKVTVPAPNDPPTIFRARKDILSLTPEELQTLREKLDDVLNVCEINSKWQEFGIIRGLHLPFIMNSNRMSWSSMAVARSM